MSTKTHCNASILPHETTSGARHLAATRPDRPATLEARPNRGTAAHTVCHTHSAPSALLTRHLGGSKADGVKYLVGVEKYQGGDDGTRGMTTSELTQCGNPEKRAS